MIRYSAILASAVLCAVCSRIEQPWALLVWIILVPWLLSLQRERSMGGAVVSGLVMSAAFTLAVFSWFSSAIARYTATPPAVTYLLLIVAAPLLQPQFVIFAGVRHLLAQRSNLASVTALGAGLAWLGAEWVFPRLFGDSLGHGVFPYERLRQGADIAGVAGLTLVVLLVNESVANTLRLTSRSIARAALAALPGVVLISALAAYGQLRIDRLNDANAVHVPLTAVLIQANMGNYEKLRADVGTYNAVRRILDKHEELSANALAKGAPHPPADLLVWPETVYPTTFGSPKSEEGAEFDAEIVDFVTHTDTALLFGTYERHGDEEFNAAALVHPRDKRPQFYLKRHLFPLTEETPAWLDSSFVRELLPWLGAWRGGTGQNVLSLRRRDGKLVTFAPLICLDAVHPNLAIAAARAGADLIVNISNDAWFADTRGARLHLVVSAFRSIETRLPQLRTTNTGISAVINPTGRLTASSRTGHPAVLAATVRPGARGSTLMMVWGDWLGPTAAVAACALLALCSRKRRRVEAGEEE